MVLAADGPAVPRDAALPNGGAVRTQAASIAELIIDLQARGMRVEVPIERRQGGAGPSDSGMLWIGGFPVTVPTDNALAQSSPYVLAAEDDGYAVYRDGERVAEATGQRRPRFYDLQTADGIPYWKIALLHLDSFASTVVQTCTYWGNDDQCKFCGIGLSLAAGRTIVKKTPDQLAEVAVAAKTLDAAIDATLTTGSSHGVDRGARYVARCGQAVKRAAGLPVEVQFEPPADLGVLDEVVDMGIDSVGIHIETFDPKVLAHVAHRNRTLLRNLGARGRDLRRRTGLDVRDPRDGRRSGAHGRGLPPCNRHRRVPVRCPAPPGGGQSHAGRAAAAGCV